MDVISPFVKRQAIIADYADLFLKEDVAEYELESLDESAIVNEANLLSGQTLRKLLINTDPATIQPYEKRGASPYNSVEKRNALNHQLMKKREAMALIDVRSPTQHLNTHLSLLTMFLPARW